MRRVHRERGFEEFIKGLISGDFPVFEEIWRVLVFSAFLGYQLKRREPVSNSDPGKAIPENIFSNSAQWPGLLYLFGLAETDSSRLLYSSDEANDELVTIFEEYANGGLKVLYEEFNGVPPKLEQITDFVEGIKTPSRVDSVDLDLKL